jgi:digeranylgeranylglycerophospholipid reductase
MDIVIAGGGISGCYTGQLLKKRGFDPVLLEEHPRIGDPVQCAGLIGRETVYKSEIPFPHHVIVRQIDGARLFLKNEWFEIERPKAAYVVDRAELDTHFSRGLKIKCGEKVTAFEASTLQVKTTKDTYTCDILFGCDGPFSLIRKMGKFPLEPTFYPGAQFIIGLSPEDDFVELHIYPPFFFWLIPETEETTRIGFIGPHPVHELQRFIERREITGEIIQRQAGIIPLGHGSIATKNVALIGDAACQVKPLTGGGIFYSMKAAELAVRNLEDLETYEKQWNKEFGKEIRMGLRIRNIYENINEKNLARVFRAFKENKDMIETVADFERHSSIAREFIKHPLFLKLMGSALKEFLS